MLYSYVINYISKGEMKMATFIDRIKERVYNIGSLKVKNPSSTRRAILGYCKYSLVSIGGFLIISSSRMVSLLSMV